MRVRISGVKYVLICWRHRQTLEPIQKALVAQGPIAAIDINEAGAPPPSADGEFVDGYIAQADLAEDACGRFGGGKDVGHGRNANDRTPRKVPSPAADMKRAAAREGERPICPIRVTSDSSLPVEL